MFGKQHKKLQVMVASATILAGAIVSIVSLPASAEYAEMLGETSTLRTPLIPGAQYANQMEAAYEGQPPPVGSGPIPEPVTPGDLDGPQPPPTGLADPTHGNIFGTRQGQAPKDPTIYVPNAGRRVTRAGQEQGVYEQGIEQAGTRTNNNGGQAPGASELENEGGPRGDAVGKMDRTFDHDIQPNRYDFEGPLPTVRTFCRYLVILGVVAATVWMSMAAVGMVMGNAHAGSRAIGAAAGLLLLLAGYTIWKIVQMNTFHANSTGWESHYRDGTPQQLQQKNANAAGPFGGPANPNGRGPVPNGQPFVAGPTP